jgi:integrase
MLNTALEDGRVVVNPCRVKGAGTVSAAERPTATVAELQAAIDASPPRFRLAFALAAWCQLRRAEVLGLQRGDIDLLHSELRVVRTVTSPYKSRGVVIGPPKTTAGVRTLAIGTNVIPLVVDHLERHVGPDPNAWVFATESCGPISPRYLSRAWSKARGAAGRPDLRLHDLRHSGLTWAAAGGASMADLMKRGGHANPRAALRYQHSTRDSDRVLAAALAELDQRADIVDRARSA